MLSNAAEQLAANNQSRGDNQSSNSESQSNQHSDSPAGRDGNNGTGSFEAGELQGAINVELTRRAMRNWGQLPGQLKTEILQSSQRKANGDYARLIKLYFEELAKPGQSDSSEK